MMVMTAKVHTKKLLVLAGVIVVVILGLILLLGNDAQTTGAAAVSDNDSRVKFLESFGWEVAVSPVESGKVQIPSETIEVFDRYLKLQKEQGYDLTPYAGKTVMRYVYEIKNYPNATEPVYATLLVYQNQVVGGDITDTSATGKVHGLAMPEMKE